MLSGRGLPGSEEPDPSSDAEHPTEQRPAQRPQLLSQGHPGPLPPCSPLLCPLETAELEGLCCLRSLSAGEGLRMSRGLGALGRRLSLKSEKQIQSGQKALKASENCK